jgi:DnaJ-class molecular chaperone
MPGKGDSGVYGGTPGNLFVTVKVDPTPGMEFHKDRVTVWVNASPAQFVVGDAFPVAIRGEDITVQMPPLTGRAEVTVLGVKVLVRANVVMPLKIDQAQRELYSRLLFLETGRDAGQRVSRRKLEAIPAWVAPAEDDVPAPVKEKTSLDTPLVGRKTPRHVPRKKKAAGTRKRVTPGRTHR